MKKLPGLWSIIIIFSFFSCNRSTDKIIGIKIYDYSKDFNLLVRKWKETGINTAFISKELAANEAFRNILKEYDIKVYLIFPIFYNPEVLRNDSSLYSITDKGTLAREEWVEFVCPSRRKYRKNKINESADLVRDLYPDGLSIDFIRNFVYWEKIYPERTTESIDKTCFCDSCINGFNMKKAIYIPDSLNTTALKANYILKNFEDQWINYQCDLISTMVEEISMQARSIDRDIKINVHAVPWRDNDFGGANLKVASQDLNKIASHADYISPMCYSQMLKRDAGWIISVVSEMDSKAAGKILPSIQVNAEYIDDPFSAEEFGKCIDAALKPPSEGVVFFSWPFFEKDPARLDILSGKL